jgi:hypothetical protein
MFAYTWCFTCAQPQKVVILLTGRYAGKKVSLPLLNALLPGIVKSLRIVRIMGAHLGRCGRHPLSP